MPCAEDRAQRTPWDREQAGLKGTTLEIISHGHLTALVFAEEPPVENVLFSGTAFLQFGEYKHLHFA